VCCLRDAVLRVRHTARGALSAPRARHLSCAGMPAAGVDGCPGTAVQGAEEAAAAAAEGQWALPGPLAGGACAMQGDADQLEGGPADGAAVEAAPETVTQLSGLRRGEVRQGVRLCRSRACTAHGSHSPVPLLAIN